MTDSIVGCTPGFMLDETAGIRSFGRPDSDGGSCISIKFPSNGISYSEVSGRVVGYQYGSPDALRTTINNIDSYYVDGVSITQGYPRKYVWTLTAESNTVLANCPCNTPPGGVQPDYFCESGNPNSNVSPTLYSNDPLWDGEGCGTHAGGILLCTF